MINVKTRKVFSKRNASLEFLRVLRRDCFRDSHRIGYLWVDTRKGKDENES